MGETGAWRNADGVKWRTSYRAAEGEPTLQALSPAVAVFTEAPASAIPQTTVLTLNGIEARRLASPDGVEAEDLSLEACASGLWALGAQYVLIRARESAEESTSRVKN